jgi:hypothetical protein
VATTGAAIAVVATGIMVAGGAMARAGAGDGRPLVGSGSAATKGENPGAMIVG